MKTVKLTEQEYLMNAVCRWDNEAEGYYEPSQHELQVARSDLHDLVTRCKRLLPTAKEHSQDHAYWRRLYHAVDAVKRGREDIACGWLYEMLYFHSSGNNKEIDRRILVNIIGMIGEERNVCLMQGKEQKARRFQKTGKR